jgi:hypothetical protein
VDEQVKESWLAGSQRVLHQRVPHGKQVKVEVASIVEIIYCMHIFLKVVLKIYLVLLR